MDVYLVDGTYELFRYHFALPSHVAAEGREVAATRGVVGSAITMLESGVTHLGVATDHVIESFRNELWPGYKTSAGVPGELLAQFPLVEEALLALGVGIWPMVELEADDALASVARTTSAAPDVDRVFICTPDKDLGQCVAGKVVQFDRRRDFVLDDAAVKAKFGVPPSSIPDYLALVGDKADGFPGLAGWGATSTAAVLATYEHLEEIPAAASEWTTTPSVRNGARLAATLQAQFELALLFRRLATLESDEHVVDSVGELEWQGPRPEFFRVCGQIDGPGLAERAAALAAATHRPRAP